MSNDPEERKARKREQNRVSAKIRRAQQAGALQGPPPNSPRLTANLSRAATVRDPDTGRKFDRTTEVFDKCLKIAKTKR